MTPQSVTIIGTGALASLVGARLSRAGCKVTLAGTWGDALEAIGRRGIVVDDGSGTWRAGANAARIGDTPAAVPLVLVLVKSHRTDPVAAASARAVLPEGLILTLQNGLGSREILAASAGPDRVAAGVAYLGATLLGPAHVRDGGGSLVVLEAHDRARVGAAVLRAAGFEVALEEDIAPAQWAKLAVNCAVNPLSALLGVTNGELLRDPATRATVEAAAREVGAVAAAQGIRLARDPAELAVEVACATSRNRSSMLQDIRRGAATEIEALNGMLVRAAERLDVSVPINRRLLEEMRQLERHGARPA